MSDIRQRIRDAVNASVDDAEPSFDVMTAVRQRHRRRLKWQSAAAAAAVLVVAAASVFLAVRHALPGHQPPRAPATSPANRRTAPTLFPGGGRLLLADAGRLRWLYPDGRTIWIPGRFDGARVFGGELLAWKYTPFGASYYTMGLDGARQRLVLPAGHDNKLSVINALLSPDGTELAYIRQDMVSPAVVTFSLWILNLATGQRADLGPISTLAFAWLNNATILTAAPGSKSLLLVNATTGGRTAYLTVTDPALTRAYEEARPGAGPPAHIGSDGITGTGASSRIAVWLAAASHCGNRCIFPQVSAFTRPAEVVLHGRTPLVTYAPKTPQQLSLTFGRDGLVLFQTGAGDLPGWNTYVGTLQSSRLSGPVT